MKSHFVWEPHDAEKATAPLAQNLRGGGGGTKQAIRPLKMLSEKGIVTFSSRHLARRQACKDEREKMVSVCDGGEETVMLKSEEGLKE